MICDHKYKLKGKDVHKKTMCGEELEADFEIYICSECGDRKPVLSKFTNLTQQARDKYYQENRPKTKCHILSSL